ncbi:hypothetical protein C454_00195 [Haloferax gibbonsii ATCC 33959]|uniref:Zinc ribbon domain-containing protein n=1 Tax=Haloferax gibbonsii (strain ATCC 33959 / DSM 4427 / JCM 8863 / NBRC 102184 / NCIMB 2188 / Ma 2.38) TaxID=1227459 RepID=M0HT41_HALGM|nr:zinc ribbon domain-containing protein [Haloferax gibbonsii]ELZ86923.1 hypothetical protein C454_00195 [Haloferax gibbonsii ATCC 33959]
MTGSERVIYGNYLLDRDTGSVEKYLDDGTLHVTSAGALYAAGPTLTAYALGPESTFGSGQSRQSSDTQVYRGGATDPPKTNVYDGTPTETAPSDSGVDISFCPSCGISLEEFTSVSFCPSCGTEI